MQRFWRLLKPDTAEIRNIYAYAVFAGLVSLSLPLGIQAIVNLIQGGQISTSWIILVSLVVAGMAFTSVLQILQIRIAENIQQKIFARASFEFAYRIPRIRMEDLYRHYAPELVNRFFDTMNVQKGLAKILIDFSSAALSVAFGLILLSLYHPFFIAFSVILLVLVAGIFYMTGRNGLRTSLDESTMKYRVAFWLEELARTSTTFKLVGNTQLPLSRTDRHVGDYLESREGHFQVLIRQYSLMVIFKVVVAAGLLVLGGILVMQQRMNIGQFVAAELIILKVMDSVEKLVLSMETIYDVLTGLEKIGQVTDLELEQETGVDLIQECATDGLDVELDKVTFRYPGQTTPVLDQLSLNIEAGEKVMLTGNSGSGKSTLLHIIGGLYEISEGSIVYHGLPKGNLDRASLREVIGDAFAQEQLFHGTVLENIAVGRRNATFENVRKAVKNLELESFIKSLPQGYETIIDPSGKKLPQTVVNKLLLARSIAAPPKMLLLEDAFEHFDNGERQRIIDYITSPERPWTLVAVSADKYLAARCDRIAVLQKGKVVETGTYRQLSKGIDSKNGRVKVSVDA